MTSAPVLIVTCLALLCGALAAWLVVPHPPALDGEAWFKGVLVARLRGRDAEDIARWVHWHPLGRWAERKLVHPEVSTLPAVPLPGEEALIARLATLPDPAARWRTLRQDGASATLALPDTLPDDCAPGRWAGRHAADVADRWARVRDDGLAAHVESRLHATWVLVDDPLPGAPDIGAALAGWADVVPLATVTAAPAVEQAWRSASALAVPAAPGWVWGAVDEQLRAWGHVAADAVADAVAEALALRLPDDAPERRLIVAVTGRAAPVVLRALYARVDVRDRVIAVVSVGGAIGGGPATTGPLSPAACADWLEANFHHDTMDVEILRRIPYVALQWIHPDSLRGRPGAAGVDVAAGRFPEPTYDGRAFRCVEPVDLGVLPVEPDLPLADVAGALRTTVGLWVMSRR